MEKKGYGSVPIMEDFPENTRKIQITSVAAERKKPKTKHATWFFIIGLAEVIGTFLLVFLICTGATPNIGSSPPSHLQVCIVAGIAVAVIVQVFGQISGAHINPAVTVAACVFQEISLPAAVIYVVAQFVGATLGYGTVLIMTPLEALYTNPSNMNITHGFCTTVPNPKVTTIQALLAEYAATSVLIYVCCSVWDKRNAISKDSVPIKFGLTIAGIATAFGSFSGASLNPARTFGPAVFTGVWDRQWIYWLGPLSAALITSYFYKFVFYKSYGPSDSDQAEIPLNQHNSKVQNLEKPLGEDAAI